VARATRGTLPDWERLEREAEAEADARLAWPAPRDASRAIDCAEHDLASLQPLFDQTDDEARGRARYLLEMNDHLARALRSQWARWWKRWCPADGIVRATEHTAPLLDRQRPVHRPFSVTALERFSYCPYRFLLSAIHRLEPREEASSIVQMDPLTKGSLIHEVQARTLAALRDDDRLPLRADEADDVRRVLDDTVDRVSKAYEEDLAPAIERVWKDEVESIRADLRVWLRRLADEQWTPAHFELTFGLPLNDSSDPAAVAEPVVLDGGWLLRGAIDLVERGDAGLRVTDHKTGVVRVQEGAIVGGGESLQPVLYSLAAEKVLKTDVVSARLSYCTARGGFEERAVDINEWSRLQGRQVLEVVDRAVEKGHLHPAPREKACKWCDFRTVCGPHEERRVREKESGPLADLRALRQLP
jgi:CRISPR/Cas system-associated exonuclease Cas4 (RecB family)